MQSIIINQGKAAPPPTSMRNPGNGIINSQRSHKFCINKQDFFAPRPEVWSLLELYWIAGTMENDSSDSEEDEVEGVPVVKEEKKIVKKTKGRRRR